MSSQAAVPRRKHRGRNAVIAIVVVIVVLIAAFFIADYFVKKYAENYVRSEVATALGLSSTAPVKVDLGSGSILLQAVSGAIDNARVTVDPLVIQGLTGSAALSAQGVPLSSTAPVKKLAVDVVIPDSTITKAITEVPSLTAFKPRVTIANGRVLVTGSISIFGLTQHIGVSMIPKVTNGTPSLGITSATFDSSTISITQLNTYIPGLSKVLQSGTSLCIADQLPKDFVLTGVTLRGQSLVSTFTGDGVELNDTSLSERGSCK